MSCVPRERILAHFLFIRFDAQMLQQFVCMDVEFHVFHFLHAVNADDLAVSELSTKNHECMTPLIVLVDMPKRNKMTILLLSMPCAYAMQIMPYVECSSLCIEFVRNE